MRIDNEFSFKEVVYLKTDLEQRPRMVMAIEVYPAGELLYKLAHGTITSYHYGFELSREKDVMLTTTN